MRSRPVTETRTGTCLWPDGPSARHAQAGHYQDDRDGESGEHKPPGGSRRGGLVTLSGGGKHRILYMNTCGPRQKYTTSDC
jgi:hypothetical protein